MKVKILLLLIISFAVLGLLHADLPSDPGDYAKWEQRMLAAIEQRTTEPLEVAAPKLGEYVHKLSFPWNRELGNRKVFHAAQKALLAIPGHAEYFGNKIRNDDILRETGRKHEVKGGVVWDFETLGQLPSPETVRVLGSFLDDERHRIHPPPGTDVAPVAANNLLAARALHSLKIINPPLHKRPGGYDDVHPWRLWFAQVEAGTRTFRFEGDPQEYSLAGPVSEARAPLTGVDSGSERPTPPPASPAAEEAGEKSVPVVPLAAAGLLLAVAFWLVLRGTRRREPPR